MDKKLFSCILDGYSLQIEVDNRIPIVSDYLRNHDINDPDFMMDLLMYSSDEYFMKRKYEGPLADFNVQILDNKDAIIRKFRDVDSYRDLKYRFARDLDVCSSVDLFRRYKQIYRIDRTFLKDLCYTQSNSKTIPLSVFKHMPYDSFYLDLSDADICDYIYGCFVSFRIKDGRFEIFVQVIGKATSDDKPAEKGYFGAHMCRCSLDIGNTNTDDVEISTELDIEDMTIDEALDNIKHNIPGSGAWDIVFLWYVIVPILLYLSSNTPDIEIKQPVRIYNSNRKNNENRHESIKVSDVGFVYGSTVRNYKYSRRDRKSSDIKDTDKKQTKRSHMRRAHWHKFRCGKGREDVRVIWMPPMYIQGNSEEAITIHKVK